MKLDIVLATGKNVTRNLGAKGLALPIYFDGVALYRCALKGNLQLTIFPTTMPCIGIAALLSRVFNYRAIRIGTYVVAYEADSL